MFDVELLRHGVNSKREAHQLRQDAADEIERLRAALEAIKACPDCDGSLRVSEALSGQEPWQRMRMEKSRVVL